MILIKVKKFLQLFLCLSTVVHLSSRYLEFLKFAISQEDCRKKWLMAENEVIRLQSQLNESNKINSKLELQMHHITVMLKDEIKVRQRVQHEKKSLVSFSNHLILLTWFLFICSAFRKSNWPSSET